MLETNGSIFIKLGQHLAAMGYLLPTEWVVSNPIRWRSGSGGHGIDVWGIDDVCAAAG